MLKEKPEYQEENTGVRSARVVSGQSRSLLITSNLSLILRLGLLIGLLISIVCLSMPKDYRCYANHVTK